MTTQKTISVTYHNLPAHLRKEAVARAKTDCGIPFKDVLRGDARFLLTCPADPYQTPRQLVGVRGHHENGNVYSINTPQP